MREPQDTTLFDPKEVTALLGMNNRLPRKQTKNKRQNATDKTTSDSFHDKVKSGEYINLRASERLFIELANSMPQLVWTARPDGRVDYYNKRYKDYEGIVRKGSEYTWAPVLHPEDLKRTKKAWEQALKHGTMYEIEHRVKLKNGAFRWHLSRAVPVKDKLGKVVKWYGTATDIHNVKQMEANLRQQSDLNKLITSNASSALFLMDDRQFCTFMNPAAEKMTAFSFEEIKACNRPLHEIIHQKYPDGSFYPIEDCPIDSALPKKNQTQGEDIFIKKDGTFFPVSFTASPILENGKAVGTVIEVQDISRQKQAQQELERSESMFRALYDSNIIGVMYCDLSGKIYSANDALLRIFGYSRKDFEKSPPNWAEITPIEHKPNDRKAIDSLVNTGAARTWEKEFIRKDGSRVPVIIGATLLNKENGEALAFVLDIEERKRLEQRKDEFIGVASHELKTPLTSIKGYTQLIQRILKKKDHKVAMTYLARTNLYIDRLNALISDLLDVSKIQAGKMLLNTSEFSFKELLGQSIEVIQPLLATHKILVEEEVPDVSITGDCVRLEQVLVNLLSNAIKYSPDSTRVEIKAEVINNELQVMVKDHGIGIPYEEQARIFERFYRIENRSQQFSGLGIGLFISTEIIKRHYGRIWVQSKPGKGSSFYFTLPLAKIKGGIAK